MSYPSCEIRAPTITVRPRILFFVTLITIYNYVFVLLFVYLDTSSSSVITISALLSPLTELVLNKYLWWIRKNKVIYFIRTKHCKLYNEPITSPSM